MSDFLNDAFLLPVSRKPMMGQFGEATSKWLVCDLHDDVIAFNLTENQAKFMVQSLNAHNTLVAAGKDRLEDWNHFTQKGAAGEGCPDPKDIELFKVALEIMED